MKLKTLKDLSKQYKCVLDPRDPGMVPLDILKQEAIKWIKDLENHYNEKDGECKNFTEEELSQEKYMRSFCNKPHRISDNLDLWQHYESSDITGAVEILKYFFNITEEDLK